MVGEADVSRDEREAGDGLDQKNKKGWKVQEKRQ